MANVNDIFAQYEQKQAKASQGYGNFRVDPASIQQPQAKTTIKNKRDLLDTLLSIGLGTGGAIGGSFAAPIAGTVAGGAGGAALAEAISQLRHGEADSGAVLRETALGGLFSVPVGKVAKGGLQLARGVGKETVEQGAKQFGEQALKQAAEGTARQAAERSAITNFGEGVARRSTGLIAGTRVGGEGISKTATEEAYRLLRGSKVISPTRSAEANLGRTEDFISRLWRPLQTSVGDTPVNSVKIASQIEKKIAADSPSALKAQPVMDLIDDIRKTGNTTADVQRLLTGRVDDVINFNRTGAATVPGLERAGRMARTVLLDSLPGASREVKGQLSKAYKARELLQKASSSLANTDKGGPLNQLAGPVRQIKGGIGESIQKVGQLGELGGVANQLPYATKGYGALGRNVLREGVASAGQAAPQQQIDPVTGLPADATGIDQVPVDQMAGYGQDIPSGMADPYADLRMQLQDAMLNDLQTTGGKNVAKIKTVMDSLPEAPGLDANSKKNVAKFSGANAVLDTLERQFGQAGGGRGTAGGLLGTLTSMVPEIDPGGNVYQGQRQAFLTQIIRAMGEVGTLTDKDREVVANAIPQLTDTPQTAQMKIQTLRDLLGELQARNAGYGDTSLQDVLYGGNLGIR